MIAGKPQSVIGQLVGTSLAIAFLGVCLASPQVIDGLLVPAKPMMTAGGPKDDAGPNAEENVSRKSNLFDEREIPFQIGLAGAPISYFGDENSPTFETAFQQLADSGFDFFFPLFVVRETQEQATYSTHGDYFFPASLTGKSPERACGGSFNPYSAALGKLDIWYPGIQLLGLLDTTQPIVDETLVSTLAGLQRECPDLKRAVTVFYSFDEPSLNRVVANYLKKPLVAAGNEAKVAQLVRQAWGVPVVIVDAPDESTIQTTGLPANEIETLVDMFWKDVEQVASSQDGYGFDVYSIPDFRLTLAGDYVKRAKEIAVDQRIVSVIQGMSFAGITGDSAGGRAPTEREVRFQAIDSLVAGADFLCWYGASSLDLMIPADRQLWEAICAVAKEIQSMSETIQGQPAALEFSELLGYRCYKSEQSLTVFLTNRSQQVSQIPLSFAADWSMVEVIAGPMPERTAAGWLLECPPETACIYQFRQPR